VRQHPALAVLLAATFAAAGCGRPASEAAPAAQWFAAVAAQCGKAFGGRVVTNDPPQPNDPFEGQPLVMHVRTCESGRLLLPFHVGEDRSRTWVLTLTGDRLQLKHDHRHKDGSSDVLTMYGGDTTAAGTATRQEFPADQFSKELFTRENRAVSNTNTWAMEMHAGRAFVYELARPGRLFRVEFDLTKPVAAPPPAWGH
jgi:hypothetical protein